MSFNWSVVDELRLKREPIPAEIWNFVDPEDIDVRTAKPKWTWVARVCHEIPMGKCILLPRPEGMQMNVFIANLRVALAQAKATELDKFSIRRAKHDDYAVVMKSGTWATLYRAMESEVVPS